MNSSNAKNMTYQAVSRKAAIHILKLAAWGVLAGAAFGGTARGDDAPLDPVSPVEAAPAEQPTAAVDPAPVVPSAAPGTVEVKTPEPKAPEPKTPDVTTPDATIPKTATTQPIVAVPTTRPASEFLLVASGLNANGNINLMVNKSTVITTRAPYKTVHIPLTDVAEAVLAGPNEILVTGKKPGSTQLIIWDAQDHSQVVDVVVGFDLRGLDSQIKHMFPKAAITTESANGTIVLRGHVPNLLMAQQAAAVATPYGAGGATPVLNFLEVSGGQQVVLQVRFAEVSRSVTEGLGFNAFATDGKFSLGLGNGGAGAAPTVSSANVVGTANPSGTIPVYGGAVFGNASFEYFITALRSNNLLRILAEPNVTAISGQQASFLAGGEYPVPVPQTSGGGTAITIEYKQYGIQLNFTPTVLGDGRIRLQCSPQVSELDPTNSVSLNGFTIPALTTRTVNTTVELAEGQTFSLAGLLQNEVKASKSVTPGLGDLPILGALFRSVNYQRSETELVVLVTPRMVEALNPNQVPRLPGDPWRDPTEAELYLNMDLGGPAPDIRHAPPVRSSHFYGPTGFNPAPSTAPTTTPQK